MKKFTAMNETIFSSSLIIIGFPKTNSHFMVIILDITSIHIKLKHIDLGHKIFPSRYINGNLIFGIVSFHVTYLQNGHFIPYAQTHCLLFS